MSTPTTRRSLAIPRLPASDILGWAVIGALMVLVGVPVIFVLVQAVFPGIGLTRDWGFSPQTLAEIAERPLWQQSLRNSLVLAGGAMIGGGLLGFALAVLRHTVRFPGARLLDVCAWVLLVTPSFILAQGWVLFASPSGTFTAIFGSTVLADLVFTPGGLIVIMSLTRFPLSYLATTAALHWEDPALRHAAALSGARGWTILRTVRLPLLAPAALSGAVLIFIDTIGDFGLPAALSASYQFPTLPYSIYASVRQSPVRFELAGVLSLYLVAILSLSVLIYLRLLRRHRFASLTAQSVAFVAPPARRPWRWSALVVAFAALSLGVPLGSSLYVSLSHSVSRGPSWENLTLEHYRAITTGGSTILEGAVNSLLIAAAVAVLATILGFLIGVVLTFTRFPGRGFIDLTSTITLAIPGIVLAVGYIFVWNQPVLSHVGLDLYGRPVLLVLAGTAAAVPVALRLQLGALAQVPESQLHAAALSGVPLIRRLRTIVAPLIAPAVLSALVAVFASGVFDLAATTMLAPPSFATLPVEILREYDRGKYGYATAGAIFSAVVIIGLAAVSTVIGRRLTRRVAPTATSPHRKEPAR
ncbi:iron ABC transporter permease [Aeromicrobium phragmitis]|uniref:Iron ABC transporter permease n=1 Tax=Aeromicrobium phragmitis TaxID=2478914 RepID=A0A3L8PHR2_9ACTN|nr:iron ABC transporter permease [Aeromicrobium phragmitis]RLV54674.1 iron ABC transporter permease [Aeromicrobium phragmitis]